MPGTISFMLEMDTQRFFNLVFEEDLDARAAGFSNLHDVALCEILRYGIYSRDDMILTLRVLYRACVRPMPLDHRTALYEHAIRMVETGGKISVSALLPFVTEDLDLEIVSRAVIDYASLGPLKNEDPMTRPKMIVEMIRNGTISNVGAAFGALLNLGDERVCDLIRPLRDALAFEEVTQAIRCSTGFVYSATTEFYIEWLESLDGSVQDRIYANVASGLLLLKRLSSDKRVIAGFRPFPTTGLTDQQQFDMLMPIPVSDYAGLIAERLYALERSEPPPRVMPLVLMEWGLEPRTSPAETIDLNNV